MELFSWYQNELIPTKELKINFTDDITGQLRGFRIFTACVRFGSNKKIFKRKKHIKRLYKSAKSIKMKSPYSKTDLNKIIDSVVEKNKDYDGDIQFDIIFSGGKTSSDGFTPLGLSTLIILSVKPFDFPDKFFKEGMKLVTFAFQRPFANVKYTFYLPAIFAHLTIVKDQEADGIIFVDPNDNETILEGSSFNIFMINSNDQILTYPLNGKILKGITRSIVIKICEKFKDLEVLEQSFTKNELINSKEVFITSTTRDVMPVTNVDGFIINDGKPGKLTMELREALIEFRRNSN
ncbi:aminodeoxychorismate lyase-related [Anaeramoeba ignava]|uniref:Aminodeoxychorismate lyase-related n=1 Tax=Anaeramoeba ignava TaxID=1746090 RepID=A0A9Q0LMZ7_ANAIG|nr:aminodeoxychorismate lyase-related [Anaeramoeba ignava]